MKKLDINVFIESLRTTILWENVSSYIESLDCANILLQNVGLKNISAERASVQDSEDFYITSVSESNDKIIIEFEMPFILCVNEKYNIQAVATGNLDIPGTENYPYDKYDFSVMNRIELLSFNNIISISQTTYKDVEVLGVWED